MVKWLTKIHRTYKKKTNLKSGKIWKQSNFRFIVIEKMLEEKVGWIFSKTETMVRWYEIHSDFGGIIVASLKH